MDSKHEQLPRPEESPRAELAQVSAEIFSSDENESDNGASKLSMLLFRNIVSIRNLMGDDTCLPPFGNALSPYKAAACIYDLKRTKRFIQGLDAAIREAQNKFPGEKITILYAGCGPFATLALPVTTRFRETEIGFVLLDIHETSIACAEDLIATFDLQGYFPQTITCDAISYRHQGPRPHILLTETMASGLLREPQVAITANLAPQLKEGGILVPEEVVVSLAADLRGKVQKVLSWEIYRLNLQTREALTRVEASFALRPGQWQLEKVRLETAIKIFGPHALPPGTSVITEDLILEESLHNPNARRLNLLYTTGSDSNPIVQLSAMSN